MTYDVSLSTTLNVEEQADLQTELFKLLAVIVPEYTKGKSTSIPESLAKEIMESILFNLRIKDDMHAREILNKGIYESFEMGEKITQQKAALAKRLWKKVFLSRPDLFNYSMLQTLSSIKKFPAVYDCCFFAHKIPCEIDYQLCIPVSQELKGIDYVVEYLRHLLIENAFLNLFDPENCKPVLNNYCKTWQTEVLNIFDPVAETAIMLAFIGGDIKGLKIGESELTKIYCMLSNSTQTELAAVLNTAARQVIKTMAIKSQAQKVYLLRVAENMVPRFAYLLKKQVDY